MTDVAAADVTPRAGHARVSSEAGLTSRSRVRAVVAGNGIGAVVVVLAWWGVSGERDVHTQIGWLCLSGLGLLLAGVVNGSWFARGRRTLLDARTRMRALALSRLDHNVPTPTAGPANRGDRNHFGAADKMSRYHRDGCVLTRGKTLTWDDAGAHEAAGRAACEVCAS